MSEETKEGFPVDLFLAISGSASATNGYSVLGLAGQQFFIEKYLEAQATEDKEKLLDELKK